MKTPTKTARNSFRALPLIAALALFLPAGAALAQGQNTPPQILPCPDAATRHWDKIVFRITDKKVAERLRVPLRAPLDIKVLDDPNSVADLQLKVIDFFRNRLGLPLPEFRDAIDIEQVSYAIAGCVALPGILSNGDPSCTSTVTSGPGLTTATAICGLSCPSAHVTNYVGAGLPFMSFSPPQYVCNGKPSHGTSSITCSC